MEPTGPRTGWTFLTHHAGILAVIMRDPEIRLRDLAEGRLLTERAARAVVGDLERSGYLTRVRHAGNRCEARPGTFSRHPAEGHRQIANLLRSAGPRPTARGGPAPPPQATATASAARSADPPRIPPSFLPPVSGL